MTPPRYAPFECTIVLDEPGGRHPACRPGTGFEWADKGIGGSFRPSPGSGRQPRVDREIRECCLGIVGGELHLLVALEAPQVGGNVLVSLAELPEP